MDSPQATATRPRVEGERELEILDSALRVLTDVGYDKLTMDAVAAEARASKATLYRRWSGKAELVVEALIATKRPASEVPDTGTLRGDLLAAFCGHDGMTDPRQLATFTSVLTALARDPEFAEAYRRDVLGPKIDTTREIYRQAQARGELRPDADIDILAPALAGVLLHRYFLLGDPPTPAAVARALDQVILPAALA